ncbi:MAG TPA: hypothetical protein PK924_04590 [Bacilli bacterium]|nr:hypothetical protein [Bacilli bacterium]
MNVPVLNLTDREVQTLVGILLVEEQDLKELIETADNPNDKAELEGELERVESIKSKLK